MSITPPSPRLLAAIALQIPDGLICAGTDGNILVWNDGAERIFGHSAAEAVGRSLDLIIPEAFRTAHHEGFRRAITSGRMRHAAGRVLTTRSMHKNGDRLYVDLSFGLIRDEAGAVIGVLAIARDCTARELSARAARKS